MQDQQQQFTLRLKETKNVLVTVSNNPSVDQLAAAMGLTLALNRMDKHATAVFSGEVPSTIQFLRPEDTLEKTTDSLRDFIIALDKTKADKLRYKVEDQVVRIFITPYHTALSDKDLDFSQGDFNVDTVVAIGIQDGHDIDTAVQAHGQILHNATVMTMALEGPNELGAINWVEPSVSSLSEMTLQVIESLDKTVLDGQIATSLLTGIVAMTERFSNDRTSPQTMNASATLMAAGANQQLITSELEAPQAEPEEAPVPPADTEAAPAGAENSTDLPDEQDNEGETSPSASEPGVLEIEHEGESDLGEDREEPAELPEVAPAQQIHVDENGHLSVLGQETGQSDGTGAALSEQPQEPKVEVRRERMDEAPSFGNKLTANTEPDLFSPPTEQLTRPAQETPILHHDQARQAEPALAVPSPVTEPVPLPETPALPDDHKTLTEIEESVHSPHTQSSESAPQTSAPFTPPVAPSAPSAFPGIPPVKETSDQPAPPPVPPPYIPPTE